jgi:molybdopterin/thiamine biosynthesis adenylyltransferase
MYDSQILLIGRYGQELLRNSTIGIVGVGGGGSHVAEQVARAGFGHILLVDHDVVEGKNRSRMVGTRPGDGGKLKVSVIERLIRETGSGAIVTSIAEKFPSENGIKCLKEADLVVSCVDTLSSRSELVQFAWRHLIPLIDIGIGTTVQSSAEPRGLTAAAGHIHVYLPGGPCMYCSGLVSDSGIIAETGGKPEYIKGARSPGQVISFNGVVASMAVTEAINLITGSLVSETRPRFILYDVIGAKLHELAVKRNPVCRVCSQDLGAGDPIW